jgi:hypothetical protein
MIPGRWWCGSRHLLVNGTEHPAVTIATFNILVYPGTCRFELVFIETERKKKRGDRHRVNLDVLDIDQHHQKLGSHEV